VSRPTTTLSRGTPPGHKLAEADRQMPRFVAYLGAAGPRTVTSGTPPP
jgi:hypothetical protein